jgi:hypothetical protein
LTTSITTPDFAVHGLVSLSEFLEDRVVFRDLQPVDRRYQGFNQCARDFALDPSDIPRKTDPDYNKVAVWIVDHMQEQRSDTEIQELLFVGDTRGSDLVAFEKMITYADWKGSCFIGDEALHEEPELRWEIHPLLVSANRWSLIAEWIEGLAEARMAMDSRTAVIVDIDKTAIGAQGRNHQVINDARVTSLRKSLEVHMSANFDFQNFRRVYDQISRPEFQGLTVDNEDYIIYICLMIMGGVTNIKEIGDLVAQRMSFLHLVRWISTKTDKPLVMQLRQLHDQYQMCTRTGDRTPFKQFRRQEFLETTGRMGIHSSPMEAAKRLESEICITQEVRELCDWLNERGCLLLAMSDKPKEASMPHQRWHKGMLPVHRTPTYAVGTSIREQLDALN